MKYQNRNLESVSAKNIIFFSPNVTLPTVRTRVEPTRAARRHAMTPSRRCRPTPHPSTALSHAPLRSLKLRLSFLMLVPVDVAGLSLLLAVSGRSDTIRGGAPSFSLRGNGDPKHGHSFF
jgi:hypothetical protein